MSQINNDSSGVTPSLSLPPIKIINLSILGFFLIAVSTTSKWPTVGGLKPPPYTATVLFYSSSKCFINSLVKLILLLKIVII